MNYDELSDDTFQRAFRKIVPKLMEKLTAGDSLSLATNLESDGFIIPADKEDILSGETSTTRANKLLDIVQKKGASAMRKVVGDYFQKDSDVSYRFYEIIEELLSKEDRYVAKMTRPAFGPSKEVPRNEHVKVGPPKESDGARFEGQPKRFKRAEGGSSEKQYLAVVPLMSTMHTHLEVHVQCKSSREELKRWIELHKEGLPKPVDEWIIDIPTTAASDRLRANMDSTMADEDAYSHGSKLVGPSWLEPATSTSYAWLFDLAGKTMSRKRKFQLQLFNEAPNRLELCGSVDFTDFSGSKRLRSLGFSDCSQMPDTSSSSDAEFGRQSTSGVYFTSVVKNLMQKSDSVGLLVDESNGDMLGTGFCIGREDAEKKPDPNQKFIMTCNHVWPGDVTQGDLSIIFGDSCLGVSNRPRIKIKGVKWRDEDLDVLVLSVSNESELPKPIRLCSHVFEKGVCEMKQKEYFFTVIGWPSQTQNNRSVDFIANWFQWNDEALLGAKAEVTRLWKKDDRLPEFLKDYNEISTSKQHLLYNISVHQKGSSGSPVLYCRNGQVHVVAIHRCGLPDFYHREGYADVREKLDKKFTVEGGTRMSSIYDKLGKRTSLLDDDKLRSDFRNLIFGTDHTGCV